MKKTLIIFLFFFGKTLTAQTSNPIIIIKNLDTWNGVAFENLYVKDIDNFLNQFEGTWVFQEGNQYLKIVLEKKVNGCTEINFCKDYLIGEYQYKENGSEIINTLTNLSAPNHHSIYGGSLLENHYRPICNNCYEGQRRVRLVFQDRTRELGGDIVLQYITVAGEPALKAFKRTTNYFVSLTETSEYSEMLVPSGEYILIKE